MTTTTPTQIPLTGALTIYTAEENRLRLAAALNESAGLEVNLGAVTDCDTAGIQLICSASATAFAANRVFTAINPPACVLKACDAIGVDFHLFQTAR